MDFTRTATTVIDAPAAEVFERITDIEHLPDWNLEIPKVIERPAVLGVGAQWVVQIHAMKMHWDSRSTVTELDPAGGRFAYRSQSDDGNPSFAEWLWELAEVDGGTRVTVSVAAHPKTLFRRLVGSRIRPRGLGQAMQQSLETLREQVPVAAEREV
jgi:uncharacterized protein YndB with AHSA1/START domain